MYTVYTRNTGTVFASKFRSEKGKVDLVFNYGRAGTKEARLASFKLKILSYDCKNLTPS